MSSINATNGNRKNKIIWAVDPTQNPTDAKNLIKEMKSWAKHLGCAIQPVSIFSNRTLNFPVELAFPWKEKFEEVAQKSIDRYFKKAGIKDVLPPEKIFISSNSNRKMAAELAKYAEKKKGLLIFAHTKAKKTWNPFRLGGFAETLAAVSRTPVLLLNPEAKPSTQIPSILFPTDFSQDSKNALLNLSSWAKAFHSKVLLYSQVETPAIYTTEYSGYWPAQLASLELLMKDIEKSRQKKAQQWSNILAEQNVDTRILIQHQKRSLGSDVLEAAKKSNVNLIALASHSGPVTQAILGGVARDVLLQAKCPVLIFYRPKAIRKHTFEQKPVPSRAYSKQKETSPKPPLKDFAETNESGFQVEGP
jgi:nucleotide-binding universal stress UspA family protein